MEGWIQGCFQSLRGSILVNGLTTEEMQFYRKKKKKLMEKLQVVFQRVVDRGLFSGISFYSDSDLYISHMFYANTCDFCGRVEGVNVMSIVRILYCFCLAFLRINFNITTLIGGCVPNNQVNHLENHIGCAIMKTIFFLILVWWLAEI